jgi:hypothetical protein
MTLVFVLLAAAGVAAQNTLTLGRTTTVLKMDGIIGEKEYTLVADAPDMKISLSWTTEVLYVGVSGQTRGWVAVGLGSGAMDGATMYIGSVSDGKTRFKVQKGAGHSHSDAKIDTPLNHAMTEADGSTTLELALQASEFISPGQRQLDIILAMGSSDSFSEYHQSRYGTSVRLTQ